jgi:HD superfamily phosphodiesterase
MIRPLEDFIPSDWESNESCVALHGHSIMTARAAKAIANLIESLDPDRAYNLGLFHDVGKFWHPRSDRLRIDFAGV